MNNIENKDFETCSEFEKHLVYSEQIVNKWPIWKQSVLGGQAQDQSIEKQSTLPQHKDQK